MRMSWFVSLDRRAVLKDFRRMRLALLPVPLFCVLLALLQTMAGSRESVAQQSARESSSQRYAGMSPLYSGDFSSIDEGKRLNALNADRQKKLIADTNKLLSMATELNAEMSGANAASLTPDQLRKVAQMEKLARSVREKMSKAWIEPAMSPFSAVYR